jgi:hypothetical protein
MGLVAQRHSTVSKTECSMAGDKTRLAHTVEDIIGYSWPLGSPRGHLSSLEGSLSLPDFEL